jgi:hypothetical protein
MVVYWRMNEKDLKKNHAMTYDDDNKTWKPSTYLTRLLMQKHGRGYLTIKSRLPASDYLTYSLYLTYEPSYSSQMYTLRIKNRFHLTDAFEHLVIA